MNADRLWRRAVLVVLALLGVYHAWLLGAGALAFPDEHLYRHSLAAGSALLKGDPGTFAAEISAWGSRPAEYLVRLPSALVQLALEACTGLSPLSPRSLPVAAAQNVVVSLLLGLVFYQIAASLLPGDAAGVVSIGFALLTSNQQWVRHMVPYDLALALHLWALRLALASGHTPAPNGLWSRIGLIGGLWVVASGLYPLVFARWRAAGGPWSLLLLAMALATLVFLSRCDASSSARRARRAGLISGIALATYPAYYSFVPAVVLVAGLSGTRFRPFVNRIALRNMAAAAIGAGVVVCFFEALSRAGGVSYLGSARILSSTITQGEFSEGFVFLGKWLASIDGPAALWILPLGLVGLLRWPRINDDDPAEESRRAIFFVALAFLGLYLIYGFQSAVLHRMTFTGRYARMYLPALLLLAGAALARTKGTVRRAAPLVCAALSVASFAGFARGYADVGYPADELFRAGITYEDLRPNRITEESPLIPRYTLPVREFTTGAASVTHPDDDRFLIVNFGIFSLDGRGVRSLSVPEGFSPVSSRRHFLSWGGGVWEGYDAARRNELRSAALRLKIFRRQDGTS